MSQLIPSTAPLRVFKDHKAGIWGAAIVPGRRRMLTSSLDKTLRLWDLRTGAILKKMEGHCSGVQGLAVSGDGQIIASGDFSGEVIAWHGETGEPLTQPIKAHSDQTCTLDFSPDGTVLASGSHDSTAKLLSTKTWQLQGNPIQCSGGVWCVRYSPSGEHLAIATWDNIEIYNSSTREPVANFEGHTEHILSLAWTPDGTRLLSGGNEKDPSIREWDTSTWQQVGDSWTGHTHNIWDIAIHPAGTHIASASEDNHVRLWRLSDQRTIAIFQHSGWVACVTFSMNGKRILSGGGDTMISEWKTPKGVNLEILSVNATAHDACITGDLSTAEEAFTQEIDADANAYTSYAHRSFLMARKHNWDEALDDANKSVAIQPSLTGYISKGIALCGKGQVKDARTAFDIASIFTNEDSKKIHFLLLVKVIALFRADQHQEAMQLVQQLAAACPDDNALAYHVVEAYLHVQLGINALNGSHHDKAADHFTAAINSSTFPSGSVIDFVYDDDLMVLFGLDLEPLWKIANQKRCDALLRAGRLREVLESHQYMMDMSDEPTKAGCLDWSIAFTRECSMLCLASGDAALAESDYDRAIDSYSVAIDLNSASDTIFANRSKARAAKMLWEDALLDAQKVIELNPSSHVGYEVKHAALRGAQCYGESIETFKIMLDKLDNAPEAHIRELRQQYVSPSETEHAIRRAVWIELENAPLRLLDTSTGLLCNRVAQINAFKMSAEYKELLSFTTKRADLRIDHIKDVVAMYFRCVLLSHRWEEMELLLHDIQDKVVYELNGLGGIVKLQSFCKVARDAGYYWAWMDTCCIDKNNNAELQESINSMFIWYRYSALTIVYLCDVYPSSHSGTLAESEWIKRGWTFQEFVAPKVVLFYRMDWSLYLDDRSPNHKESAAIMEEFEGATGINRQALVTFRPGMSDVRERLQWASTRVTTLQEDIAYSLFGIFGIHLPVIYGEKKQNALGRLLQEIVARSGDITALDWVGQSSEFNSCLPADITSYAARPCALPSLSEDEIRAVVSSLRNTVVVDLASKLYDELDKMSAPRFANCRLHLPCITFRVTEVRRNDGPAQETHSTYELKTDGLHDLLITTKETMIPFMLARPPLHTLLLVRPWDCRLLELPDFAELHDFGDDTQSEDDFWSVPGSPLEDLSGGSRAEQELVYSESHSRALRLIVRLGQPFGAFLLARQRSGEYKRIASDHDIIAQVKDIASVDSMMDIRTLEIS